jgi:beta-glucosidase
MASFSSWNGIKNHGNPTLLTDALKGAMGFEGLLVGDWNGHAQIPGCSVTNCPAALIAGLDMYMAPDSWKGLFDNLVREVRSGEVPMARLDDAVRRILRVKAKLGVLDGTRVETHNQDVVGSPEHLVLAREAVAKSLVLLKNNGAPLPIRPGAKVLVAGDGADNLGAQSGGWTITWQGTNVTRADFPNGRSIWDGINTAVLQAGGTAKLSPDGTFASKPDIAIVVYGEQPYAEFQGDIPTLDYQPVAATNLALIKRLKAAGIPVVSVFLSGRPLFTSPEINASDAFVAAWLPGSQGDGVSDVLIAGRDGLPKRTFTGRLSFPWPADARSPLSGALFPVGYGLHYGESSRVPVLDETLRVDLAAALNVETYFAAGRARSPWTMTVIDDGGARTVESTTVSSPLGHVIARGVDIAAQEDAKALAWTGPGSVSIDGPPADLGRQLTGAFALRLDWRIDARSAVRTTLAFGDRPLDITAMIAGMPVGTLTSVRIPLRCFVDAGADIARVGNAMRLSAGAGLALILLSAKVEPVGDNPPCPPSAPN